MEHLDPSDLGTKAYWDAAYALELRNHASNAADEGTVWFADASAEERMLSFLARLSDEGLLEEQEASFLDLGTGNGHLLFALCEEGWRGRMCGVDYSGKSVELARKVGETRAAEAEAEGDGEGEAYREIRFEEWDLLRHEPGEWLGEGFDVVLDKGTFDAISLSGETDAQGRRICEGYRESVEPLVKEGGRFLITSCNWTSEELKGWFGVDGGRLAFESEVKYPSFTFGGKTGQQVCTLCFRKKSKEES